MTRWKAQGIATVAWFAGALGLTFAMPESRQGMAVDTAIA